jgi:hypothetical protein
MHPASRTDRNTLALASAWLLTPLLTVPAVRADQALAGIELTLELLAIRADGQPEIGLSVSSGSHRGAAADWWLVVQRPDGQWQHLDLAGGVLTVGLGPTYQGPLSDFSALRLNLPVSEKGDHRIYFGVDLLADGDLSVQAGTLGYVSTGFDHRADWWRPKPGTSWQWQLSGALDSGLAVDMYDVDLFDTSAADIQALRASGSKVICYFSAGSREDWRPDAGKFPAALLGSVMDGWPNERWLDIRALDSLAPVMTARLDLAVAKGCDGVEPDNVDGYLNQTGFALTYRHQLDFNIWLSGQAHRRGLSIGLKNDLEQIADLLPYFDWALNEQCFEFGECDSLSPFVDAGKAVFGVEYNLSTDRFCDQANARDFDWLRKDIELGSEHRPCR